MKINCALLIVTVIFVAVARSADVPPFELDDPHGIPPDAKAALYEAFTKKFSDVVVTRIAGCGIRPSANNKNNDVSAEALYVANCDVNGGQWITIHGRNFGASGALVRLTRPDGSEMQCGFPTHWSRSPTQTIECRLPFASHGTVFDLIVVNTQLQKQSLAVRAAVRYAIRKEQAMPDFDDFEAVGIGGLRHELVELKRKVFAVRRRSNMELLERIGMKPVRGVVLYGPPGTGKTLVARKIAEVLQAKSVKVVNGPEIMSKYIGESESNMRGLFSVAENDHKINGKQAGLHVVVLDEMDAMLRHRGAGDDSAARAVYDGVTTQLLAIMDGIDSLPNVLLVGLTNRIEGIDAALLRPGRFEIKLRIPLPDEEARHEILRVHTKTLRDHGHLGEDVDLAAIAKMTTTFTGADIEGTVRAAIAHAAERGTSDLVVTASDMHSAVRDIFSTHKIDSQAVTNIERGIVDYGPKLTDALDTIDLHLKTLLQGGPSMRSLRILLRGPPGCGLTALASLVATRARLPYTRIFTASSMLGRRPEEKLRMIQSAFDEVQDVSGGIVVLDTVEELVEYHPHGTRVNGHLLTELQNLLCRTQPRGTNGRGGGKLFILMTSHSNEALNVLQLDAAVDAAVDVELLDKGDQVRFLSALNAFKSRDDIVDVAARLPARIGAKQLMQYVFHAAADMGDGDDDGAVVVDPSKNLATPFLPPITRSPTSTSVQLGADDFVQSVTDFGGVVASNGNANDIFVAEELI